MENFPSISYLRCPIRGELKVAEKDKNGLNFTEEKNRIDLVRLLLNKGYPKNLFDFEYVIKVGNAGKTHIRADLVVYKDAQKKDFLIASEIKKDSNGKYKAIKYQLKTYEKLLQPEFSIYYDGLESEFFHLGKRFSLNFLPNYGENLTKRNRTSKDLTPINSNLNLIFERIDNTLHSLGYQKKRKYNGIFQVILAKYFDEQKNYENLKFRTDLPSFFSNLKELYDQAFNYYFSSFDKINLLEDSFRNFIFNDSNIALKIMSILENYSFLNSDLGIIQAFFMRFGAAFFQKENFAQYYTPVQIIEFVGDILNIEWDDKIIDPAGGSGDFLVGALKKMENVKNNIFYWDIDPEAAKVATLNMILQGDGRSNIAIKDSIKEYCYGNEKFSFVLTNPPFGKNIKWGGDDYIMNEYDLGHKNYFDRDSETFGNQLGKLFIERGFKLLKNHGIMVIVLPSGYLNNKNREDSELREWIFSKMKVIADISLPAGIFKSSETGVKTDILIVEKVLLNGKQVNKEVMNSNYSIFVDVVEEIGFDFSSKRLKPLYLRDDLTGEYLFDEKNERIFKNDLTKIAKRLKQFAYDNSIEKLVKCDNGETYDSVGRNELDILKEGYLKIKPESHVRKFSRYWRNTFDDSRYASLGDCRGVEIGRSSNGGISLGKTYNYFAISEVLNGCRAAGVKLRGWQIREINRAKQIGIKSNDIYLSYLQGSHKKFFYCFSDEEDSIITSGMIRVRILDEVLRLSFFKFLFSYEYSLQFNAFATGHIQTCISPESVKLFRFKILTSEELYQFKSELEIYRKMDKKIIK